MEYFDVLNKDRKPINKIVPRGTKLSNDEFNQGVEVWIITPDHKILITQRSQLKSHPLMWEAPGGCSIAGENTIQTAIRELKEEIGLTINCNDLLLLETQLYKYQFVDIFLVKTSINLKNLVLQDEEVAQAKLVSFNEFENLINDSRSRSIYS